MSPFPSHCCCCWLPACRLSPLVSIVRQARAPRRRRLSPSGCVDDRVSSAHSLERLTASEQRSNRSAPRCCARSFSPRSPPTLRGRPCPSSTSGSRGHTQALIKSIRSPRRTRSVGAWSATIAAPTRLRTACVSTRSRTACVGTQSAPLTLQILDFCIYAPPQPSALDSGSAISSRRLDDRRRRGRVCGLVQFAQVQHARHPAGRHHGDARRQDARLCAHR